MEPTKKEKQAIISLMQFMASADGHLDANELLAILAQVGHFDMSAAELDTATDLDLDTSLNILAKSSFATKEFTMKVLALVLVADGEVHPREKVLLALVKFSLLGAN